MASGFWGGMAQGVGSGARIGLLMRQSEQQEATNKLDNEGRQLKLDHAKSENDDLAAIRDSIRSVVAPKDSATQTIGVAPIEANPAASVPDATPAPSAPTSASMGLLPVSAIDVTQQPTTENPAAQTMGLPATEAQPSAATATMGAATPSEQTASTLGAAPASPQTPQSPQAPQMGVAQGPDFKTVLKGYEAGIKTAVSRGRMDLAGPMIKDAIQMRTTVRNQKLDAADRAYNASGGRDLSGYEDAYNFFPDGHTVKLTSNDDGSVKAVFTLANGKTSESVVPKADVPKYINMLRDPAAVRKQELAWAEKVAGVKLDTESKAAIERVKGEEARKTNAEKSKGDSFSVTSVPEGSTPYVLNKNTGAMKSAGGGSNSNTSFNRKDLPVLKAVNDLISKAPGMATVDPTTGVRTLTEEGARRTTLGSQIWQFNTDANGGRMTPADAANVALRGTFSLKDPAIFEDNGRFFAAPVVRYQDKQYVTGGPSSYRELTGEELKAAIAKSRAGAQPTQGAPAQAAPTAQPQSAPPQSAGIGGGQPNYGLRADGTPKGPGFLGELKRPDGRVSTELSIGVNIDGKEVEIPSLVPTLTKAEVDHMLAGGKPTPAIVDKAVAFAKDRMRQGKSVFAEAQSAAPQSAAQSMGVAPQQPTQQSAGPQSVAALNPRNPAHQRLFESMKARGLVQGNTLEEAQQLEAQQRQQTDTQAKALMARRTELVQAIFEARRANDIQRAETLSGQLATLNKQQGIAAR